MRHCRLKMTFVEREKLRRAGRENNATAGVVCPAHVKAAFNFEFDDIDIDVPLEELLVEASKETPRWRVTLTSLSATGGDGQPDHAKAGRQGYLVHSRRPVAPAEIPACSGESQGMANFSPTAGRVFMLLKLAMATATDGGFHAARST